MRQPSEFDVKSGIGPNHSPLAHDFSSLAPAFSWTGEMGLGSVGDDAADIDDDLVPRRTGAHKALEVADGRRVGDAVGQRLALIDLYGAVGGSLAGERVGGLLVV